MINNSDNFHLWLPTMKRSIERPWFLPSKDSLAEQRRLLSSTFFLVKQGDAFGERLKCTRCGRRDMYITLMCIERPFSGITGGLYAYYRTVKDHKIAFDLTPGELSRYQAVEDLIGNMPDFGTSHPETTRQIMKGVGANDMQIGALALGVLEGIAPVHAYKLVQKINDAGLRPKLVLSEGIQNGRN